MNARKCARLEVIHLRVRIVIIDEKHWINNNFSFKSHFFFFVMIVYHIQRPIPVHFWFIIISWKFTLFLLSFFFLSARFFTAILNMKKKWNKLPSNSSMLNFECSLKSSLTLLFRNQNNRSSSCKILIVLMRLCDSFKRKICHFVNFHIFLIICCDAVCTASVGRSVVVVKLLHTHTLHTHSAHCVWCKPKNILWKL